MAKNIIKARIKQRSDSAANWAAVNPVLLKGELGLVDDDPNLYKVGDGKTAWNDLPLRGFDGTVAQETGDSPAAVMSQAAVTRALEAADEKIEGKVPKETGKGLSSNDYTDAEKEKLAALENYDDSEVKEALSTLERADNELAEAISEKVDKVDGKQLTTEDFTTALKDKLQGLNNYDDAEVKAAIEKLREDFDTLVDGDTSAAIKSFNDIVAFLEGIEDSESLDSIIASIEQQIAGKQDEISDLETIRQGAAKGATALQEIPAALVEKTNAYDVDEQGRIFIKGVAGYDGTDKAEKHSLQSYLAFIENAVLSIYPQGSFSKAFSPAFSGGKITY